MSDKLIEYIDKPFYEVKFTLENGYVVTVKWNMFMDKKDMNKLVMRTRYVLTDANGERKSLKVLNLKKEVKFEQIYVDDEVLKRFNHFLEKNQIELFINEYFTPWINNGFHSLINSGDNKIVSIDENSN
jgi:hypothetical protein